MRPSPPLSPQTLVSRSGHHRNSSLLFGRSATHSDLPADHRVELEGSATSHESTGSNAIVMRGRSRFRSGSDRRSPVPSTSRIERPSRGMASGRRGRSLSVRGSRRSMSVSGAFEDMSGSWDVVYEASSDVGEPEVMRKDIGLRGLRGLARGRRPGRGRKRLMTG